MLQNINTDYLEEQSSNNIYIVGDAFKSITDQKKIFTTTDFLKMHHELKIQNIYFEQGINESEYENIKSILSKKNDSKIKIQSYFNHYSKCENHLTHKYKKENVLISSPVKIEEDKYSGILMIDDACAELSDHVTGKHLQFMVLMEAARQMANAVTEKFYSTSSHIYLSNRLEADFKEFIYPLKTELTYEIKEKKIKFGGNGKMTAIVSFIQNNRILTTITFEYSILNRDFVTKIEDSGLQKII